MNNTKETIGPRGTVAGFRPLIGKERWHRDDFTAEMLKGGYRPLLDGEEIVWGANGDEYERDRARSDPDFHWQSFYRSANTTPAPDDMWRTKRHLPQPQVETFEAHGHVWYRHVPGDACPVEADVVVDCLYRNEEKSAYNSGPEKASKWDWIENEGFYDIIGYRFPDFQAVHTTLQQEQHFADAQDKTSVQQPDTTKQHLLRMYHGWCDFAPDDVEECMEDVRKLLYPTDAERCEAAFESWFERSDSFGAVKTTSRLAWKAAWNAAKQEKP